MCVLIYVHTRHVYEIHVYMIIVVYFDRLEENGSDIAYTLRFPYEQEWSTNEIAFDLSSTFIRTERYVYI